MALTTEQQDAVDLFQHPDTKILLIDSVAGSGKQQPLTSRILTPSGWTTMGDISIGDIISSQDGTTTEVTHIHPQGLNRVYVVHFMDGTSVECGDNHIWKVWSIHSQKYLELTTTELMSRKLKAVSRSYIYSTPLPEPVEHPEQDFQIHPYLLGALIADGGLAAKQITFHTSTEDKSFALEKIGPLLPDGVSFGLFTQTSEHGYSYRIRQPMRDIISELELNVYSRDRFIPDEYLFSSIQQRRDLLAGLMDADGSASLGRNRVTYSTSSLRLAQDIISLVQSLGGLAKFGKPDFRKSNPNYTVSIKFNSYNPFTLPRKRDRISPRIQNRAKKSIVSIEETDRFVEQQCITVANPDGLYITDHYTVTHNSYTLEDIAALPEVNSGICIVYNKSVADENKLSFPSYFQSSTIHSLAYQHTVRAFGLSVGFFNARDVKEKVRWEYKSATVEALRGFCLSRHLKVSDYCSEQRIIPVVEDMVTKYIKLMKDGKIPATHDFYMKYFHMLLANNIIQIPEVDALLLDECQDSFATTIEIFKLIPARKKVAVGDQRQALYSFNNCINGFEVLESEPGVRLSNLTKTFRVNDDDAQLVQDFMRRHLHQPDYSFRGNHYDDTTIKSRAFLTKNNSALIGKMIDLMDEGRGFNLLRPPKAIFELVIIMLTLKRGGFIPNPEFRHLQDDVDVWYGSESIHIDYRSPIAYIASIHSDDIPIKTAVRLIAEHGAKTIFKVFDYAKRQYGTKNHEWTLSTVFTSKGFTFDYVEISDDMNMAFAKAYTEHHEGKLSESGFNDILYQYYVICTRHRHELINAVHLGGEIPSTTDYYLPDLASDQNQGREDTTDSQLANVLANFHSV